jgi:hypothetical protein
MIKKEFNSVYQKFDYYLYKLPICIDGKFICKIENQGNDMDFDGISDELKNHNDVENMIYRYVIKGWNPSIIVSYE